MNLTWKSSPNSTFAFNNSKLFRPYIIRFITLILFTLPSAKPLLYEYIIPFFTAVKSFFMPFINVWSSGISYFCASLIHSSNFAGLLENRTLQNSLVNAYSSLNKGYFFNTSWYCLAVIVPISSSFYKPTGIRIFFAHIQNAASLFRSVHTFVFFLFA